MEDSVEFFALRSFKPQNSVQTAWGISLEWKGQNWTTIVVSWIYKIAVGAKLESEVVHFGIQTFIPAPFANYAPSVGNSLRGLSSKSAQRLLGFPTLLPLLWRKNSTEFLILVPLLTSNTCVALLSRHDNSASLLLQTSFHLPKPVVIVHNLWAWPS